MVKVLTKKANTLTTATDVRRFREQLIKEQNGIDLITKLPLVKPILEHDHATQKIRGVVSSTVNVWLGCLERAHSRYLKHWLDVPLPDLLEGCAEYLRLKQHDVYHPRFIKKSLTLYMQLTSTQRSLILQQLNLPACKNDTQRKAAFKKYISKGSMDYQEILDMFEGVKSK